MRTSLKDILQLLKQLQKDEGESQFTAPHDFLIAKSGYSITTVIKALRELESSEIIKVERCIGKSNLYEVVK